MYTTIEKQNNIAIIWLDQPNEKVNKISSDLLDEFKNILDEIEKDNDVKGIVLISKKPDNFIAGADLEKFLGMKSVGEAEKMSREGHILLNRMENFSKPIIAAINGATFGGGLEVALACHVRIATDDSKTVLGLPEVKLGLLPGGGGTQRLPRLIGIQKALDIMLTGKNIYPYQAKKMGLVDYVVNPYALLNTAKYIALQLSNKPIKRKKKFSFLESTFLGRYIIYNTAKNIIQKQTFGNYSAPFNIIECVKTGIEKGINAGFLAEEKKFDELVLSPQSKELINLFFGITALKKNPLKEKIVQVKKIGILGAGFMGSGIANVSVTNGIEVFLKDINHKAVGNGIKVIWEDLDSKVKKRALLPFERDVIYSRITGVTDYTGFEKADLVIEAVFEDVELKRKVLAETESATNEKCIFASNTSSLPITEIAKNSKRPEQVIGMHYFSPVPKMPLLEIIITKQTSEWVTATAVDVGIKQGKTVIVVNDGPGFYTTRILAPFLNETLTILEEGGEIEQIDRAMKFFGFPVGPITLLDEVGIDVGAHVSGGVLTDLFQKRGITSTSKKILDELFKSGYKGRKNKKGFYIYDEKSGKKKGINSEIYNFFGGKNRKKFDTEEIQNRISLVMVNEAMFCLQENILTSPRDGDMGAILGLGFPPFLGGPFRYTDKISSQKLTFMLRKLEDKYGARFTPAQILVDKTSRNEGFYRNS